LDEVAGGGGGDWATTMHMLLQVHTKPAPHNPNPAPQNPNFKL